MTKLNNLTLNLKYIFYKKKLLSQNYIREKGTMYLNLEAFPNLMGLTSLHLFLQYKFEFKNDIEIMI